MFSLSCSLKNIFTSTINSIMSIALLPLPKQQENYELYSANFTASLETSIDLKNETPKFVQAVKENRIRGARYFNATTQQQISEGICSTLKEKTTFSTKRRRMDFDHQISIFWKKGFHVKVFKTGKLLIPNCGSESGAFQAFHEISMICGVPLKLDSMQCNNQNIRMILDKDVDNDNLFQTLSKNKYQPEKTKKNRVKCTIWWNTNYDNGGICDCQPHSCKKSKKSKKRKRCFEQMSGKCIPSTVMFGKKSWTVFGTSFQKQRDSIVKYLRNIEKKLNNVR